MAGTRIKVKGEMPAAAQEAVTGSAITLAALNAWLDTFEATMLAAGFVRTADTGQLSSVTAVNPAVAGVGYRLYALNDEFSASSPLILKATFAGRPRGTPTSANRRLRCVQLDAALASDGLGNLVGPQGTIFTLPSTGTPGGTWRARVDTYAWRKDFTTFVALSPTSMTWSGTDVGGPYSLAGSEFFFAVSRMRDREGNVDLAGFNLYGALGYAIDSPISMRGGNHTPIHLALVSGGAAFSAGGGSSQLLAPSSRYVTGEDSKPILQAAFKGYTREGSEYPQPGIYVWQGVSRLSPGTEIMATDSGASAPVMPLGYVFSLYDLSKLHELLTVTGSNPLSIYPGHMVINGDCGLALDWSDV